MPNRATTTTEAAEALLADPGVLGDGVLACWHTWRILRGRRGQAVLPWRGDFLAATAAGVALCASQPDGPFDEAVVLASKHRVACLDDCLRAWRALPAGGRLLLAGGNDVGIRSTAKQLSVMLDAAGLCVANRARSRVVAFHKPADARCPEPRPAPRYVLDGRTVQGAHGVFSGDRLDAGSALLLTRLDHEPAAARVLDIGAGLGVLGLSALRRWPAARGLLLEADARAVAAAEVNAAAWACAGRCRVAWWDVTEDLPGQERFDLALINPPCHRGDGTRFDTAVAEAMFAQAADRLAADGRVLVVANRQLGYERALGRHFAQVERPLLQGAFKILRAAEPRREG